MTRISSNNLPGFNYFLVYRTCHNAARVRLCGGALDGTILLPGDFLPRIESDPFRDIAYPVRQALLVASHAAGLALRDRYSPLTDVGAFLSQ